MNKNYVVMKKTETGEFISIHKYNIEKISTQNIKDKISEMKKTDPKYNYILIDDPLTIEILNYIYRYEENTDLKTKCENLESAMEDIEQITSRFT